jgi:integrase
MQWSGFGGLVTHAELHQTVHSEGQAMAIQLLDRGTPSPLEYLIDDYLSSGRARGLSPKSDKQYTYALRSIFLPWCNQEGITHVSGLDRRTLDRFSASLLNHRKADGEPLSRHSVHTYLRPVRLMLTWAAREGEDVQGKPQLPRRSKPIRDVLSRDEIDQLERALTSERDKLIIRIFGDCGLRIEELSRLRAPDVIRSGRQAYLRVLGKRSQLRDVPIPPDLLRRLTRLIESRPSDRASDHILLTQRRKGTEATRHSRRVASIRSSKTLLRTQGSKSVCTHICFVTHG